MECEAAREAMLECEPAELEGVGNTALAAHLRSCAACRRRAGVLVAELRDLDRALATLAATQTPAPANGARGLAADVSGDARWQRLWRLAAPVAVAAALAVLVLAWPRGSSTPRSGHPAAVAGSPVGPREAAATRGPELRVRVPPDARVAVFQTRDPSVAVVWFFPAPNGG